MKVLVFPASISSLIRVQKGSTACSRMSSSGVIAWKWSRRSEAAPPSRARSSSSLSKLSSSSTVAVVGSAMKHGMSSSMSSTVSPAVSSLDKASAWLLALPFLYLISKSNSERRSLHRINLPLGSVTFINHLSEAWSVCTINRSPYRYGLRVWTAQMTARHSFSDTE